MTSCGMLAEDCASDHATGKLRLTPTIAGYEWRGPCPVYGDGSRWFRLTVRNGRQLYNCHCGRHGHDELMITLADLLPGCIRPPRPGRRRPIDHDDLIALLLSGMPPVSIKLAGLELAGMTTSNALDKLGVRREHRSRVISARTQTGAEPQVTPCTKTGAAPATDSAPKRVQNRRSQRRKGAQA